MKNKKNKIYAGIAACLCALSLTGCATNENTKDKKTTGTSTSVVEEGDVVKLDFVGTIDGKEFEGGSSSNYVLEVGSNTFIDGFEEQIVGHKANENFEIEVLFPEDYGIDDLNGKEATFKTSIKAIYKEAK